MHVQYTAVATSTGGRDGRVRTDDGKIDVALNTPVSMGGPGGAGTNSEQLFAACYAACFEGAIEYVARRRRVATGVTKVTAKVSFARDSGGFLIGVELIGSIPLLSAEDALELMHAAHVVCPYSKATRGNIDVTLSIANTVEM